MQQITVLAGGAGAARFLRGLRRAIGAGRLPAAEVTVVGNTADDLWLHGLKVCPDLDTVMYTLGDGVDAERGWGRSEETWSVHEELAAYGVEPTWPAIGDREVATHLVRTQMLDAGYPLSQVTEALCRRWAPEVRLLPMSDDRVETHVAVPDADSPSGRSVVHHQEYRSRLQGSVPAETVVVVGLDAARPAPGVVEAIEGSDLVLLPPADPVASLGTILGVAGVRDALAAAPGPVVGLSPVVGSGRDQGTAHRLLAAAGVEESASGVALHHGARSHGGVLDGWLVDEVDRGEVAAVTGAGITCRAVPLTMTDTVTDTMTNADAAADLAVAAVGLAEGLVGGRGADA